MKIYYSFIILCYNEWQLSKQAIITLIKSFDEITLNKGIEILIINNGSTDYTKQGVTEIIKAYNSNYLTLKLFSIEENIGYPAGINYGLNKCSGEIITVINNDLEFTKGWFKPLVDVLKKDEKIGVVAPYLSCTDDIQDASKFSKLFYTNRVIGACMVLKREVISKVGGNDFWFGIGHYDDDDWCMRIRIAGYKIAVIPNSLVHHIGSATFKKVSLDIKNYIASNRNKFLNKWQMNVINTDRDTIILNTQFSKILHYIPLDYSEYQKTTENKPLPIVKRKRILVIADWNSCDSMWPYNLSKIRLNTMDYRYYIWIPSPYYHQESVIKKINNHYNSPKLYYLAHFVPHIALLNFIYKFDGILKIDNDFINKYIVNMCNQKKQFIL